jgi:hypothetical protein
MGLRTLQLNVITMSLTQTRTNACYFCGCNGHWVRACPIQAKVKAGCKPAVTEVPATRSRSRKTTQRSLEDLLFDNHVVVKDTWVDDTKAFVKHLFYKHGMVDGAALAEHLMRHVHLINPNDRGHLKVIGYMVAMYCEAGDTNLKTALRMLQSTFTTIKEFMRVIKVYFGLVPMTGSRGVFNFRKYAGYSTYYPRD